jgi:XTP/dITP diphosphohydrolase
VTLLEGAPFRVIGPDLIADLPAPVEDGRTFEANARKKALHYSMLREIGLDALVLADDSGLEIDALQGRPGVRSARLGGPSATDADRVHRILAELEETPWERRTARFRCVLAVARRGKILATFEGRVDGRIAFEPAGADGFGYDPIFFFVPAEMTFAQMTAAETNHVRGVGPLARPMGRRESATTLRANRVC